MFLSVGDLRILWLIWLFFKYLIAMVLFVFRLFDCGSPVTSGWVASLVVAFHQRTEFFWSIYYSIFDTDLIILDWFWSTIDFCLDVFNMVVKSFYELEYQDIIITVTFLIICGDFANLYCEIKVRALYRQTRNDFNKRYYKADFYFPDIINLPKWNRFNPAEEKDKYAAIRCKVMEFITSHEITITSLWFHDFHTIRLLKKFIKEELLKMKKGMTQVKGTSLWDKDRWKIVPTPKALKLQNK